jgi:hypothetical protein
MPYECKEHDGEKCDHDGPGGFDVVNRETEEVKAHHDDKPDAERQVRVLHEIEREEE